MEHDLKFDDPVLVWVGGAAPSVPVGARFSEKALDPELVWLDVCIMGTHLPQMYRWSELEALDADVARTHGLCVECLGFGTPTIKGLAVAAAPDQVANPCSSCEGSGRVALRVAVKRSDGAIVASLQARPHEPVMLPDRPDMCMACAYAPDSPQASHTP